MSDITRNNEEKILGLTVKALLDDPRIGRLRLCYEDSGVTALDIDKNTDWLDIMSEAFACDSAVLRMRFENQKHSFVYFIWGNGDEGLTCICDHGVSLEETLKPVTDWIEAKEMEQ